MIGEYKIDGVDLFNTYGTVVGRAPDELLFFPESKEVYMHDFGDENGREYYLSNRFWNDKIAILPITIMANGADDFWDKWEALLGHLQTPGERSLYIHEFSRTFKCFYLKTSQVDRLTLLKAESVAVRMDLQFQVIDVLVGEHHEGGGGEVIIKDQNGNAIQVVQAPGEFEVISFSGIKVTRGNTGNKIIAKK